MDTARTTTTKTATTTMTRRRRVQLAIETGKPSSPQRKKKPKHRREVADDDEEPFLFLMLKVGTSLAMICLVAFTVYRRIYPYQEVITAVDDADDDLPTRGREEGSSPQQQQQKQQQPDKNDMDLSLQFNIMQKAKEQFAQQRIDAEQEEEESTRLIWNLTLASHWDAFAIAARNQYNESENSSPDLSSQLDQFWTAAAGLRERFTKYYSKAHHEEDTVPRALLERGLDSWNVNYTACRMKDARSKQRPFSFAFGGYSVTAGRGNYHTQSYPSVMEKLMSSAFATLDMTVSVRNAAIGGCPAFPYGWCMSNFWGSTADVVSWDYSMNEAGGDPVGLEAYIRHVLHLPRTEPPPMLIVKDTHLAVDRKALLDKYVQAGIMHDPVIMHSDPAVKPFLDQREEVRPIGFQEWRKFGSPHGAPGQSLHHPAVKEHEFLAWLLTMYFLAALELVAVDIRTPGSLQCTAFPQITQPLPPPLVHNTSAPWTSLMVGEPINKKQWRMNPVHCRTSFEPILSGDLSEIIIAGTIAEDIDVMLPKSKMFYNKAWVYDLSDNEKQAKRKLDVYGGLGYVDSKKAYYGIYTSGTMHLLLPYTASSSAKPHQTEDTEKLPKVGDRAMDWFKSIVLCQVNEKRQDPNACNNQKDITYILGGINATHTAMAMEELSTLYLGLKLCTYIPVPEASILTTRQQLIRKNRTKDKQQEGQQGENVENDEDDEVHAIKDNRVGLVVQLRVHNSHIVQREQACSISHVVWEQQYKS